MTSAMETMRESVNQVVLVIPAYLGVGYRPGHRPPPFAVAKVVNALHVYVDARAPAHVFERVLEFVARLDTREPEAVMRELTDHIAGLFSVDTGLVSAEGHPIVRRLERRR